MFDQVLLVDVREHGVFVALTELGARPGQYSTVHCETEAELIAALQQILKDAGHASLAGAAFGAPGPYIDGAIQLTHASKMRLDRDHLQTALGARRVELINDFQARALAMPLLSETDFERIGGSAARGDYPAAALGPGAGLGVSILNPDGFVGWTSSAGEGGHVALAAASEREAAIIGALRERHGHVSAERILSEEGLENIAWASRRLAGHDDQPFDLPQLIQQAIDGDPAAVEVFELFSAWLGAVAGDLALTAGARSGVYIFSPLVVSLGDLFDRRICRDRFEAKGPMSPYMRKIGLYLVKADNCGLLGLSNLLTREALR
ncbi:ROK family protein [Caulobacter sp. 1776]|uniref:glucokinase n=1 Tax=Caulobacter sp. 1776 TaxID=3156420 RepID=UPI00339969E0